MSIIDIHEIITSSRYLQGGLFNLHISLPSTTCAVDYAGRPGQYFSTKKLPRSIYDLYVSRNFLLTISWSAVISNFTLICSEMADLEAFQNQGFTPWMQYVLYTTSGVEEELHTQQKKSIISHWISSRWLSIYNITWITNSSCCIMCKIHNINMLQLPAVFTIIYIY